MDTLQVAIIEEPRGYRAIVRKGVKRLYSCLLRATEEDAILDAENELAHIEDGAKPSFIPSLRKARAA